MENIEYEIKRILKETNEENFRALPIKAQERIIKEFKTTKIYLYVFQEVIPRIVFKDLIEKLDKKRGELEVIHNISLNKPLNRYG